jgi:hypothetical protein
MDAAKEFNQQMDDFMKDLQRSDIHLPMEVIFETQQYVSTTKQPAYLISMGSEDTRFRDEAKANGHLDEGTLQYNNTFGQITNFGTGEEAYQVEDVNNVSLEGPLRLINFH